MKSTKAVIFYFFSYLILASLIEFLNHAACGVCHSDLHVIKGELPFASPCVVGHEITGEVVEHGPLTDTKTIERFKKLEISSTLYAVNNNNLENNPKVVEPSKTDDGISFVLILQIPHWSSCGWSLHNALWKLLLL